MKKIQPAVLKETKHIAIGTAIGTLIMLIVLAIIGKLDIMALYSAVLGAVYATANFFWLAMSVQKAADSADPARGKSIIKLSYNLRLLGLLAFAIVLMKVPVFIWYAGLIPVVFPRITILAMSLMANYAKPKDPKDKGDEEA